MIRTLEMVQRPQSLTIISYLMITLSVINGIITTVMVDNPVVRETMERASLPVSVQLALEYLGLALVIVSFVGVLRGHNWGRWLYLISSVVGSGIVFLTSPTNFGMIPGVFVVAVISYFLFRPEANRYFAGESAALQ